jgi:indoleacetamide hydrolase
LNNPPDPARRAFLTGATTTSLTTVQANSTQHSKPQRGLTELTAVQAVAAMTRGELSVEQYASALLRRCEEEHSLNAFITLEPDRVLETARQLDRERGARRRVGPLFGLPIPVKDSVNTRDYPTTAGTPALRHFRPSEDAPVVQALRTAGAIVLGKTNLHELSWGWTSNNHAFGAVHNPYDPTRIPGGSSGGTAAAVAARIAPLGIAEDTEGSIRVPAALCGVVGFRPTTGRYSSEGVTPISALFDQVGPHARTVSDIVLFDSVLTNDWSTVQPTPLQGVRLGVVRDYWYRDLDPEIERLTQLSLERLSRAGVQLVEGELPGLAELIKRTTSVVQTHDVRLTLPRYLARYGAGVSFEQVVAQASDDIRDNFQSDVMPGGRNVPPESVYEAAVNTHLPALRALYRDYFQRTQVAAIIFPPTLVPAPPIGTESVVSIGQRSISFTTAVARNIGPGSTAGIPGLVLPAGLTASGLPAALELDAAAGSDRALLALGMSVMEVLGPTPSPRPRAAVS